MNNKQRALVREYVREYDKDYDLRKLVYPVYKRIWRSKHFSIWRIKRTLGNFWESVKGVFK